jgi:hypothetical protein
LEDAERTRSGVSWLFGIFILILITNIGLFWFFRAQDFADPISERQVRTAAVAFTVAEVIDTVLVLIAAWGCARFITVVPGIGTRRRMAWCIALPALAALLAINIAAHWALQHLAPVTPEKDQIIQTG